MAVSGKEKIKLQWLRGKVNDLVLSGNDDLKPILKSIDEILDHDFLSWSDDVPF